MKDRQVPRRGKLDPHPRVGRDRLGRRRPAGSLGPDGNLRVHNAAAATVQAASAHPETVPVFWQTGLTYPAQRANGGTCLHTNQWLTTGDYLMSAHGQYAALLRGDGNLVLCGTIASAVQGQPPVPDLTRVYWSAFDQDPDHRYGAATTGSYFAVMQGDENFVLYNGAHPGSSGGPYWAIRNYGEPQTRRHRARQHPPIDAQAAARFGRRETDVFSRRRRSREPWPRRRSRGSSSVNAWPESAERLRLRVSPHPRKHSPALPRAAFRRPRTPQMSCWRRGPRDRWPAPHPT